MPQPRRRGASFSVKELTRDGTMKRLLSMVFKNYKKEVIIIAVMVFFYSLAHASSSMFIQQLLTFVIEPAIDDPQGLTPYMGALWLIIGLMIGVYLLGTLAAVIYTQLLAVTSQKVMHQIRTDMFNRMESLPIKFFDQNSHGEIMSYYTNDVDALYQFLSQSLVQFLATGLTLLFATCYMIYTSLYLVLVVALGATAMILVTKKLSGKSATYFFKQQQSVSKTEGFIEEMMNGLKVVKVFTHEEKAKEDFDVRNTELCKNSTKANIFGNIMMPILGNIGNVMYVLVAGVGALLWYFKVPNFGLICLFTPGVGTASYVWPTFTSAILISFLMMTRQFSYNVGQISQQFSMAAMALAGTKRVLDLLDQEPEKDDGYVTLVHAKRNEDGSLSETNERTHLWAWKHPHHDGTITYTELKGDILLDHVDFGYTEDKMVLHDVYIYAHPGQKIALVGATGAGKTTITNLINRFYDIQDGKIRYDGININKIKKGDLRRSLGIVLQDTNLFTGTVMENIRYGRLDATDEEVYEAAKIANAYDFITRLPQGFNTMLTADGANLSQGQRQLLSIARAACADAPVMILDEATSSIDTRTEQLVQSGMDKLMKGRTVFVIAHRLSTVQDSDAIMVLDHGRIIERGDHDSLIAQKGTYYQLYTGAFELE